MALRGEILDFPSWDGRLTPDGFAIAARAFADNWRRHNQSYPPWSWVALNNRSLLSPNKEEGYLSLEKICVFRSLEGEKDHSVNAEEEELIDHATLVLKALMRVKASEIELVVAIVSVCYIDSVLFVSFCKVENQQNEAHHYDFHIVYSASYGVPVLYFRGYCCDGQPLSLGVIETDLPACSASLLLESKWTFITQEEHPHLNRPWFKLHPCGTGEWIKLLCQGSGLAECKMPVAVYLMSWFSVVGQVVGLKVPPEMISDPSCGTWPEDGSKR